MRLTVSEEHLGTSEEEWLGCDRLMSSPMLDLAEIRARGRIVVVAPHPDDEVLGVGGTCRLLASRGHPITIVAVTDGEASHPQAASTTRARMARRRADERAVASSRLGLGSVDVVRLQIPDGRVAHADDLTMRLQGIVHRAALCLAPWSRDGHPDHDAAGIAAEKACASTGIRLAHYPIWAWHWARPNADDLPWSRLRRIALDDEVLAAKRAAITAYVSQIRALGSGPGEEAILPAAVLARFRRPFEVVFT